MLALWTVEDVFGMGFQALTDAPRPFIRRLGVLRASPSRGSRNLSDGILRMQNLYNRLSHVRGGITEA